MMEKVFNFLKPPEDKRRYFAFNICLGIIIVVFFIVIKDTSIRQDVINGWFDYYIKFRIETDTSVKQAEKNIVFLDFDNRAMEELRRPGLTPRDKIADLVRIAYEGGAKIIYIDMDFSESDYSPEKLIEGDKKPLTGKERDLALYNILKKIKEDVTSDTCVLLPCTNYANGDVKANIFAPLIDNNKIIPVTPTFTINQVSDKNVRFWSPYFVSADSKIIWSAPLMSAVVWSGSKAELDIIEEKIASGVENAFVLHLDNENFYFYREKKADSGLIRDTKDLQYNRIQYTLFPPDTIAKKPFGNIEGPNIGHWRKNGIDNENLVCKGKIAIIGRADKDCGDFFATPIGVLPGMYVHGNSICTVLGNERPQLVPMYKHILAELLLILIVAYVFVYFSETKAQIIVFIMTGLCWIGTYVYFCMTNEFLYLSFAFTSLGIYNFFSRLETFFSRGVTVRSFFRRRLK